MSSAGARSGSAQQPAFRWDTILLSSFLRPIFSMDLSIGDRVFYTRSNGLQPLDTVVGMAADRLFQFDYYQDGLRVVNRQCKIESISFAIASSNSPPDCPPSPLPNTQSSSRPLRTANPNKKPSGRAGTSGSINVHTNRRTLGRLWLPTPTPRRYCRQEGPTHAKKNTMHKGGSPAKPCACPREEAPCREAWAC